MLSVSSFCFIYNQHRSAGFKASSFLKDGAADRQWAPVFFLRKDEVKKAHPFSGPALLIVDVPWPRDVVVFFKERTTCVNLFFFQGRRFWLSRCTGFFYISESRSFSRPALLIIDVPWPRDLVEFFEKGRSFSKKRYHDSSFKPRPFWSPALLVVDVRVLRDVVVYFFEKELVF